MIPGNGVGGTLDGRRVVASLGGSGGYAERSRSPATRCSTSRTTSRSTTPSRCSPTAARRRCSPTPRRSQPGERVLVLAAAGGVGTLLVQLAVRAGATRHRRGEQRGQARRSCLARRRRDDRATTTSPGPFDVVFDGVGGQVARDAFARAGAAAGGCSPTGSRAARGRTSPPRRPRRAASRSCSPAAPDALRHTERALTAGLTPVIGQRFPLERAADAHAAIEARATIGKTLLEI